MATNNPKTPLPSKNEIREFRKTMLRADALAHRVQELEKTVSDLTRRLDEQSQVHNAECQMRAQALEALQMAQVIIDKSPVILFRRLAGEDPKLVYVSDNIIQLGYTAEAFMSGKRKFKEIVCPDDRDRLRKEIEAYAEADVEEYTQYYRLITKDGQVRWVEDQTSVVRDAKGRKTHNQGIVIDITQRKLAEDKLRKSEEKFRRIVETTGEGFLMMDENLSLVDVNEAFCRMLEFRPRDLLGKTLTDLASSAFKQFLAANQEGLISMEYRKYEGTFMSQSGKEVPVLIHGNTLKDEQGKRLGHVAFVSDLTEQKKALELAGRVQRGLIPAVAPDIQGLDIAGRSDACEEVGGDYYDFLYGPDFSPDSLKIIVGDISGHGVDAALLMTSARAFIRSRAAQALPSSEMVSTMNRDLTLDMEDTGHFMTLFMVEIQPEQGTLHWVRAGHEPALLYKPDVDAFEELLGQGLPLGIDRRFAYQENELGVIQPGMIIALGTDGIWESINARGESFGKKRFRQIIRTYAKQPAYQIVNRVFEELNAFTEGLPSHDDITLVIIKKDEVDMASE